MYQETVKNIDVPELYPPKSMLVKSSAELNVSKSSANANGQSQNLLSRRTKYEDLTIVVRIT